MQIMINFNKNNIDKRKKILDFVKDKCNNQTDKNKSYEIKFYYKEGYSKENLDKEKLKFIISDIANEKKIGYFQLLLEPGSLYAIQCSSKDFLDALEIKLKNSKYRMELEEIIS